MAKRRKGRPSSNTYFTKDTENAIVLYNNTEDPEVRSRIYENDIHYAFNRLVEAITHRFKFYHTEVDYLEQLHHEVETFLHSKIHLFDPSKGAKAFSYFGTIAKRYLIIQNTKNYKKKVSTTGVEAVDNNNDFSYDIDGMEEKSDLKLKKSNKEKLKSAITYFTNNESRMTYPSNTENNLPIGSGVIEAACKTIVKSRLCRSGMKWKNKGVKIVLSLRAMIKTDGKWQHFWNKIDQYGVPKAA